MPEDISHVSIVLWVVGTGLVVFGILATLMTSIFKGKADISAVNLFIKHAEETLAFMGKTIVDESKSRECLLERVSSLETNHNHLEKSIEEIKQHVASVDRKVHEINGGILMAINDFRKSLESQMKINQKLLLERSVYREEE